MKLKGDQIIEWFLRISISAGFLSAVADRFGFWDKAHSAWGNWQSFLRYTQILNAWSPKPMIPFIAGAVTLLEILFAIGMVIRFRTIFIAMGSGVLLLVFALAMTFSNSVKAPLDYSVFTTSAAAFSLAVLYTKQRKRPEIDDDQ